MLHNVAEHRLRWRERFGALIPPRPVYAAIAMVFLLVLSLTGWWFLMGRPAYDVVRFAGAPTVGKTHSRNASLARDLLNRF